MISRILKLNSWQRILLALFLGTLAGFALGPSVKVLKPIGLLFIHAIHMVVAPVVFVAIVCAVLALDDLKSMRRVSLKVLLVYIISMLVSAAIGLSVATLMAPGLHLTILQPASSAPTDLLQWHDIVANLIPENPVKALADGNIVQILVFALIFGCAVNAAGEPAKPVAEFFQACSTVVNKLVMVVMSCAPIGVFALIAVVSGEFGVAALTSLLTFVFTVYVACFMLLVLFSLILYFGLRLDPRLFFKSAASALLLAFTTSSSAATLPVTIQCAEKNMGIPHHLAAFLLPLGCTLNLNGLSIYLSCAVVFAANMAGMHLSLAQYLMVALTISVTAAGAGAIPGSAIIVMSAIFSSVGIPLNAIALIAGVDRLNDMAQTATNVAGDLFATTLVADHENAMNKETYRRLPKLAI